jgi:DNA-directed RNA polymerase subunit M/transcription elongation factor TFIIS
MLITIIKNDKQYLTCNKCKLQAKHNIKELIAETENITQNKTGTGIAEKDLSGYEFKCKECKNDKCKIVDLGMMFGDEDWVYLLQCTKCDYAERVGDWC